MFSITVSNNLYLQIQCCFATNQFSNLSNFCKLENALLFAIKRTLSTLLNQLSLSFLLRTSCKTHHFSVTTKSSKNFKTWYLKLVNKSENTCQNLSSHTLSYVFSNRFSWTFKRYLDMFGLNLWWIMTSV